MNEDPTQTAGKAASLGGASAQDNVMRVVFASGFFTKLGDAYFRLTEQTQEPVLVVMYGKNEAFLPFPGLRRELALVPESADARMLDLVARGLRFVRGLRIGDPVPTEILTREASWKLPERHARLAYQKVSLQLVSWMTHGKSNVTDPEELLQLAEDENTRRMVNKAFGEAAERLGIGRENREQMVRHVQSLATEVGYIGALRDRFAPLERLGSKLREMRRQLRSEHRMNEAADQVLRLYRRAVPEFEERFEQADSVTVVIMDALQDLDRCLTVIRDHRDELHVRLLAWQDLLDGWDQEKNVRLSAASLDLLGRTYHFLLPRYMTVAEWVRETQPDGAASKVRGGNRMRADQAYSRIGRVMQW